jgi:hypothetical protein
MAAKMMHPNTPDEALYMLRNFYRICCMIWGKATKISSFILDVTNHLTANHLIYDQVTQIDPNFLTKVVFIIDQAIQQVIRSVLNTKDCSEVDWTALGFDFTLRQIQTRQFNCFLPKAFHHQKRSSTSPSTSSGKEPDDKHQQKKKQQKSDQDEKPKDRKTLATNTQDLPCARIKPNEKCFCCMMLDQRVRKRFWNDLHARFWRKGSPTLDLEKNRRATFLHEYIKLEVRSWRNALSSTSSMHCASQNSNGYCLAHQKNCPMILLHLCQPCAVKLHASFSQVSHHSS